MPVPRERARLACAREEGEPCLCQGRGRTLPVLGETARLACARGEGAHCLC